MISRIIKKTQEIDSSPNEKTSGSHNQTLKPSPYIEQPQRVALPLEIRAYRRNPTTTVQILKKPQQWMSGKPEPTTQPMARKCNMKVCQWYNRKRAIKQLANYHKREKKRAVKERLDRERQDLEHKALEHFKMQAIQKQYEIPGPTTSDKNEVLPKKTLLNRYQEKRKDRVKKKRLERERKEIEKRALKQYKTQQKHQTPIAPSPTIYKEKERSKKKSVAWEKIDLEKVKKPKKVKAAKKSYAKPKTLTRAVTEKRLRRYDDLSVRFTNCFYRFCCRLYCYFTCFLIIGFVIIVIL